jgi:hypothetical protein
MDIQDAINDPERPMNIDPGKWIQLKARRGSVAESSVTAAKKEPAGEGEVEDPIVEIDMAVDSMVDGVRRMYAAMDALKDLSRAEKLAADKIKDLLDTAISPYLADIIEELEAFEDLGE